MNGRLLDYGLGERMEWEPPCRKVNTFSQKARDLKLGKMQDEVIGCRSKKLDQIKFWF